MIDKLLLGRLDHGQGGLSCDRLQHTKVGAKENDGDQTCTMASRYDSDTAPPDDPPVVRVVSHGLLVVPKIGL